MSSKYDPVKTGKRILNRRKKLRLSQDELCAMLNVKREAISQWENGKREVPLKKLPELAEALRVTTDYLLIGVVPDNLIPHRKLGLTDEAIETLKGIRKEWEDLDPSSAYVEVPPDIDLLSKLLASRKTIFDICSFLSVQSDEPGSFIGFSHSRSGDGCYTAVLSPDSLAKLLLDTVTDDLEGLRKGEDLEQNRRTYQPVYQTAKAFLESEEYPKYLERIEELKKRDIERSADEDETWSE